ncbi:MAG: phosphotransferase [Phycisphaerales bacterium]|nr:phosphotransferase [Phycisphaerales bacterium]
MNPPFLPSTLAQTSAQTFTVNAPDWLLILAGVFALILIAGLITLIVYLLVRGGSFIFSRFFIFLGKIIRDSLRIVGSILTALAMSVMALGNIILARWSAASHFGRAITAELTAIGAGLYRIALGHWLWLFGLSDLTEGLEKRFPQALAAAPGPTGPVPQPASNQPFTPAQPAASPAPLQTPGLFEPIPAPGSARELITADLPQTVAPGIRASTQFDGYSIIGTLPGGGSGSKLFIARPDAIKLAALNRQGFKDVGDVVIKVFSVREGSALPNIIRESRALEAAKRLGLVLEHQLSADQFFYVMRYVPGDALSVTTSRLHAQSDPEGLSPSALAAAVGFARDLVATLDHYHRAGLWHKDIKPDNIIVSSADNRAYLVDFGLLTPLRSSMTLTTHGTEYFRDPEMVRMALRGVKVADVDGAKFDIYGAGAVLFSIIENSFPAHGALSPVTKRCPEVLKWIIRRAMTDYDKRYPSASVMLSDLQAVIAAPDPFAMRPGQLPSLASSDPEASANLNTPPGAAEPFDLSRAADAAFGASVSPRLTPPPLPPLTPPTPVPPQPPVTPISARLPASEQLRRARERIAARRTAAQSRITKRRTGLPVAAPRHTALNPGLAGVAGAFVLVMVIALFLNVFKYSSRSSSTASSTSPNATGATSPDSIELDPDIAEAKAEAEAARLQATYRAALTIQLNNEPRPRLTKGDQMVSIYRGIPLNKRAEPDPSEVGLSANILLVREGLTRSEPISFLARRQLIRLDDATITITGAKHPTDLDSMLSDTNADALEAQLRAAVGTNPTGSTAAVTAIRSFLRVARDCNDEPFDAIVWLTRRPNSPNDLLAWVITSEKTSTTDAVALCQLLAVSTAPADVLPIADAGDTPSAPRQPASPGMLAPPALPPPLAPNEEPGHPAEPATVPEAPAPAAAPMPVPAPAPHPERAFSPNPRN